MKRFIIAYAAVVFLLASCGGGGETEFIQGIGGREFYVSMSDGNDNNDGLSEAEPWRSISEVNRTPLGPGDKVFFKRGDVWICWDEYPSTALVPRGRGEKGKPIIIGAYGSGPKPVIDGSGLEEAIRLERVEHITVQDLAITNNDSKPYMGDSSLIGKGAQVRRGVYIKVENVDYNPPPGNYQRLKSGRSTPEYGAMNGITIRRLDIYDVLGWAIHSQDNNNNGGPLRPQVSGSAWWQCGGVFMENIDFRDTYGCEGLITQGRPVGHLVDAVIEDCYIYDITCTAIYGDHNPFSTWFLDDNLAYGFTGLNVKNNVIRNTGSEGASVGHWNYVIEGNGFYDLMYLPGGSGWWAGVLYCGNNGVIQGNEIARTYWTGDSHAIDNDMGCGAVGLIQYNYVRDVTGCFLMNWPGDNHGDASTIVRYNIVVNAGGGGVTPQNPLGEAFLKLGTNSNTFFYNNVFYNDKSAPFRVEGFQNDRAVFVNNVFWTNASSVLNLSSWKAGQSDGREPIVFFNNAYYNSSNTIVTPATDYHSTIGASFSDANAITGNPGFGLVSGSTAPGGAGANEDRGSQGYTGFITSVEQRNSTRDIKDLAAFFKIDSTSPLYKAGYPITRKEVDDFLWGERGPTVKWEGVSPAHYTMLYYGDKDLFEINAGKDFFGNPLPSGAGAPNPSVGAHNPL